MRTTGLGWGAGRVENLGGAPIRNWKFFSFRLHNTPAETSQVMKKLPRWVSESVSLCIGLLFLFGLLIAQKSRAGPPQRPPHSGRVEQRLMPVAYQQVGPMVYPAAFPKEKTPRFRPNPADDMLYIEMPQTKKSTHLHIYSVDGILRASYPLSEGDNVHTCWISQLTAGVYHAQILDEEGQPLHSFPFIKR